MIELTEEQRQQLTEPETEVIDPATREAYVLVRKVVYDRLRDLFDDDVLATGEMVDQIMAEDDADDPYLESYQPSQLLVDPATAEGKSSGLTHPSAVKCENLVTVAQSGIQKTRGHLSDELMTKLNDSLKAVLELT